MTLPQLVAGRALSSLIAARAAASPSAVARQTARLDPRARAVVRAAVPARRRAGPAVPVPSPRPVLLEGRGQAARRSSRPSAPTPSRGWSSRSTGSATWSRSTSRPGGCAPTSSRSAPRRSGPTARSTPWTPAAPSPRWCGARPSASAPSCRAIRRQLYATMTGALLARVGDKAPALEVLGLRPAARSSTTLPGEPMTTSLYGDLVAVATDTAVVIYDPGRKNAPRSIPLSGHARAVLFSPSGHRLYVAQEDDELLVLDRFSGERLDDDRPAGSGQGPPRRPLRAVAAGPPGGGDSAWVVDVGAGELSGTVTVEWAADLPAVAVAQHAAGREGERRRRAGSGRQGLPRAGPRGRRRGGRLAAARLAPGAGRRGRVAADTSPLAASGQRPGGARRCSCRSAARRTRPGPTSSPTSCAAAGLPASVLAPTRSDEALPRRARPLRDPRAGRRDRPQDRHAVVRRSAGAPDR